MTSSHNIEKDYVSCQGKKVNNRPSTYKMNTMKHNNQQYVRYTIIQ